MKARLAVKIVRRLTHDPQAKYRQATRDRAFRRFLIWTDAISAFRTGLDDDQPTTDWLMGEMLEPSDLQP